MQKKQVFLGIGELTILFATLEHRLQQLLEILIGENNTMVGPLFIHNLNLVALLKRIRMIAQCKICENQTLLKDLGRIINRVDMVRGERNLLIHGDWQIEKAESFPIKVRDFKIRCNDGTWQEFTETSFTQKKVTHLIRRVKGLINAVNNLIHECNKMQSAHTTLTKI